VLSEIRNFVDTAHEPIEPDRVLATVLFTDIVNSTQRAAAIAICNGDPQARSAICLVEVTECALFLPCARSVRQRSSPRENGCTVSAGLGFTDLTVTRLRPGYNADWMARSSWKRVAPLLLRREITKRTCPYLEVLA
jgi:hypothetical protein